MAETTDGKQALPDQQGCEFVANLHCLTHLGTRKLIELVKSSEYHDQRLPDIVQEVVQSCQAYALVNSNRPPSLHGKRLRGDRLGAHWEIDFTEITPDRYGNKYLLVFVDTFSGWVEAFPTRSETAQVVAKKILEEIFPRFGLPKVIRSDNGPAFVAQVSQGLASQLGINWKLHCAYRPQSSGQVERMNRTLKETLTKLALETGGKDWTTLLPFALFRARNTPGRFKLTPYEILWGSPPPIGEVGGVHDPDPPLSQPVLTRLRALEIVRRQVWESLKETNRSESPEIPHGFQVGDLVLSDIIEPATLNLTGKDPTRFYSLPQPL